MKTMQDWFDEYSVSHQNHTNKLIHWICVPAIFFTVLGLFYCIPNEWMKEILPEAIQPFASFDVLLVIVASIFYLRLSFTIFIGIIGYCIVNLWFIRYLEPLSPIPLVWLMVLIFATAWVGQFIGHKIEGKKPSFLKDIQFLLVGPSWLLGHIYRNLGIKY